MQQLCRVCGAPLVHDVVQCSKCETPHHRDCWEYNRGCAIYGCEATKYAGAGPSESVERLVIGVREPSWLEGLSQWVAGLLQTSAPPPLPDLGKEETDLALERKEVARWIGADSPEALMHAYALFEQRHPRDALEPAQQSAAALEILEAGFAALGLEAADKAIRRAARKDVNALLARRAEALERDPAMMGEALHARSECQG